MSSQNNLSNYGSGAVDPSKSQTMQRSGGSQQQIRSSDGFSPEKNFGSTQDLNSTQRTKFRLRPEFPKIIDSITPLMYNSTPGAPARSQAQSYRFQDKGMPVLINYRALQIKAQNQKIPVNILIEYFRQWIEIMKTQIDMIVWNLYEKASNYSERCILELQDLLTYNQKYMKYIMLSIIPSREIHQNHSLNLVDQTLSRQNLKLTACQHCYDYSLECEEYVEKLLTTEKMQSEVSVEEDLEMVKNKYRELISDVECKQIFTKFTRIFGQHFLQAFAERAKLSKQVLNQFHDFRRQVGLFMHVDLLDTEAYDEQDALIVFSEELPRVDSILLGLQEIIEYPLFSQKVRNLAVVYREDTQIINQKLTQQICSAPGFMVQKLEDAFAAKFSLNMNSRVVDQKIRDIIASNTNFIQTICQKMPAFSQIFEDYTKKQEEFVQEWTKLVGIHDQEIGGFISNLSKQNPSQSLYIDIDLVGTYDKETGGYIGNLTNVNSNQSNFVEVDSKDMFQDLMARGKTVEDEYLRMWAFFENWHSELHLGDAEAHDFEVISRQLNFLNESLVLSKSINQNLYLAHAFFNADPATLLSEESGQTPGDLRVFANLLASSSQSFKRLQAHNPLTSIFKTITMKDPLLKELLGPTLPKLLNETIETPSEQSLSNKIEFYHCISQEITDATQQKNLSASISKTLSQRCVKLFRNLIYSEMRLAFNYTQIPQFKDKLQKALAEIVNSDTHTDLNEYTEKTLEPQNVLLNQINDQLEGFDYPEFSKLFNETKHILNTTTIYNKVIGKQVVHVKQQTIKDTLDLTYRYFFETQNPPVLVVLETLEVFLGEVEENIAQLKECSSNNFTGYESLQRLIAKLLASLSELQNAYLHFQSSVKAWKLVPSDDLEQVLVPLKTWMVLTHMKVFSIESKKQRGVVKYINVCEEKDSADAINDKVLRNKYFGLKSGLAKVESDKLKGNITAYRQDKFDVALEWEQKPKPTKLMFDMTLPFQTFNLVVSSSDEDDVEQQVLSKVVENENEFKTIREEVEITMSDIYQSVLVQITAKEATGFTRIQYSRRILVSSFEREVKIVLNEVGIMFAKAELFRIYVKGMDKILWKPQVIVGAFGVDQASGATKIQHVGDANAKQRRLEGAELVINEPGSTEIVISGDTQSLVYFVTIDCDGCEKDLTSYDHKIFVHGKSISADLPQSITYSMSDSSSMRKEKPIWMLGYIKGNRFIKVNSFLAKSEIEPFLQTPAKAQ